MTAFFSEQKLILKSRTSNYAIGSNIKFSQRIFLIGRLQIAGTEREKGHDHEITFDEVYQPKQSSDTRVLKYREVWKEGGREYKGVTIGDDQIFCPLLSVLWCWCPSFCPTDTRIHLHQ